ncbi:helix-turn-helix domain-containing protein [Novosphingobium tardum]|uniref:Helix-turn-helix domain-containing protein n=1 Tax=Novosphingobium tardum TaxID=1538021 RepID=A0ABV8RND0_9SPHN
MALAAHLDNTSQDAGSKRAARRKLRLETRGARATGDVADVAIHNISSTGLLLETTAELEVGETIELDLPHGGSNPARVIWASGALYGCQFEVPVSTGALSAAELRSVALPRLEIPTEPAGVAGEDFATRLLRLRKARGLTLAAIADAVGVSKPTVWAWEHGRAHPVNSRIAALAEVLGIGEAELLLGGEGVYELPELVARARERIASSIGTSPDRVRIMIDL